MKIDEYIDWDLAKEQLLEIHNDVLEGIRICDIALNTNSNYVKDQLMAKMLSIITLDESQVQELSTLYIDQIFKIKRSTKNIGEGEIIDDPKQ